MNGFVRILSIVVLVARVQGQDGVEESLNCDEPVPTIFKLGDASCPCNDTAHAGALKYKNGKVYLCVGTEWKIFWLEDYGMGSANPGISCKDILNKTGKPLSSGVFWIRLEGKSDLYFRPLINLAVNRICNKIFDMCSSILAPFST